MLTLRTILIGLYLCAFFPLYAMEQCITKSSINAQNKRGETALIRAIKNNSDKEYTKILLLNGANPNIQDDNGNTVIDYLHDAQSFLSKKCILPFSGTELENAQKEIVAMSQSLSELLDATSLACSSTNSNRTLYNYVWVTTCDKATITLTQQEAEESVPLQLLINNCDMSNTEQKPIKVNFTSNEVLEFIDALHKSVNPNSTAAIALRFKAPGLYARCIKELLNFDINNLIIPYYISLLELTTIKNQIIAKLYTMHKYTVHIPSQNCLKIQTTIDKITMSPNGAYYIITRRTQLPFSDSSHPVHELIDTKSRTLVQQFLGGDSRFIFSPCNRYLVVSHQSLTGHKNKSRAIILYNLHNNCATPLDADVIGKLYKIAVSPNGQYIIGYYNILVDYNDVHVWSINMIHEQLSMTPLPQNKNLSGIDIDTITFHPNSIHIFAIYPNAYRIVMFDITKPKADPSIIASNYTQDIETISISDDGKHMLAAGNVYLEKFFDISDYTNVIDLTHHIAPRHIEYEFNTIAHAQFIPNNLIAYSKLSYTNKDSKYPNHYNAEAQLQFFDRSTYKIIWGNICPLQDVAIAYDQKKNKMIIPSKNCFYSINEERSRYIRYEVAQEITESKLSTHLYTLEVNNQGLILCNYFDALVAYDGPESYIIAPKQKQSHVITPKQKYKHSRNYCAQLSPTKNDIIAIAHDNKGLFYKLLQWKLPNENTIQCIKDLKDFTIQQILFLKSLLRSLEQKRHLHVYPGTSNFYALKSFDVKIQTLLIENLPIIVQNKI